MTAVRETVVPVSGLASYSSAITLEESGADPAAGAALTRYKLRIDVTKAITIGVDPRIQETVRRLLAAGLDAYYATLWVDSHNRVSRVLVALGSLGSGDRYGTDVRYRDWGKPVQVDPPPPEEVVTS